VRGRRPLHGLSVPERVRIPHLETEDLGESPVWPTLAVLSAAGLYFTLPTRFIVGHGTTVFTVARWSVPVLTVALLAPLVLSVPRARILATATGRVPIDRRLASLAVIALITAANWAAIVLLVHFLVSGAHTQGRELLRAGIHMWCMNVLVFALWFWQFDGGGPLVRRAEQHPQADFLFPQQTLPVDEGVWQPVFVDYLYLAYTNATAFSPTDTLPLSRWAKVLMIVESAASLLLAIMVVARAVNILN
jgi:hypothetical protein